MEIKNYAARLGRVPLRKGSRMKVDALLSYMKENIAFVESEMSQKGYWWDTVYYEEASDCDFFWFVAKSKNWDAIKTDEQISQTPFRSVYDKFRKECWLKDKLTEEDYFVSIWEPSFKLTDTIT